MADGSNMGPNWDLRGFEGRCEANGSILGQNGEFPWIWRLMGGKSVRTCVRADKSAQTLGRFSQNRLRAILADFWANFPGLLPNFGDFTKKMTDLGRNLAMFAVKCGKMMKKWQKKEISGQKRTFVWTEVFAPLSAKASLFGPWLPNTPSSLEFDWISHPIADSPSSKTI